MPEGRSLWFEALPVGESELITGFDRRFDDVGWPAWEGVAVLV
jgi:hypothetical protein